MTTHSPGVCGLPTVPRPYATKTAPVPDPLLIICANISSFTPLHFQKTRLPPDAGNERGKSAGLLGRVLMLVFLRTGDGVAHEDERTVFVRRDFCWAGREERIFHVI